MFSLLTKCRWPQDMAAPGNRYANILMMMTVILLLSLSLLSKLVLAETIISAARVSSDSKYTRFTLESDSPIQYSLIMLKNPGRVVVDIDDAVITPTMKSLPEKINASDLLIQAVRIGQFKPHVLRLVIDLKAVVVPQVFVLEPMNNFGHRLVLDIYPAEEAASIENNVIETDSMTLFIAALPKPGRIKPLQYKSEQQKLLRAAMTVKPSSQRIIIIAIDAGHGGTDPGAIGKNGTKEKDITLKIARKLQAKIEQEPNMRGFLIRDGDHFLSLTRRRDKARRLHADLFISIHVNSAKRTSAHGSSVYALSQHGATSITANLLAEKENNADRLISGVDIHAKPADIKEVLMDLSLNATINDSVNLAKHILDEFGAFNYLHKNQVEQAAFVVLKSPDIPSILVETAFISNPDDEKKLITRLYQDKMANAMFNGIKRYFAAGVALARTNLARSE